MGLVHVSGADPYCKTCNGTGVRGFMGHGMECNCVLSPRDGYGLLLAKIEAARKRAQSAQPPHIEG